MPANVLTEPTIRAGRTKPAHDIIVRDDLAAGLFGLGQSSALISRMTDFNLTIDTPAFDSLLAKARERARARNRPVLATLTQRAPQADLLLALRNVSHAALANERIALHVKAGRMYWTSPRDKFALAGIGSAATFCPEGPDRFSSVDSDWNVLLDGAVTENTEHGTRGLGPLLMGGFAFDGDRPQSGIWKGFSSAHLIVPRVRFTSIGDDCWSTISLLVSADGTLDANMGDLSAILGAAGQSSTQLKDAAPFVSQGNDVSFTESRAAADWRSLVSLALDDILAGDMQKVVLARDVHGTAPEAIDVFATLAQLRDAHRDSFVFSYWRGDTAFVGATPERLVRMDGRDIRASSLAGTEKRGATPEEDAALSSLLLASTKDRAEHAAVRDSLFDALTEISDEVEAAETPSLLTLPNLHHLHTPVRAHLLEGHSLLDVVARLHPTPAVGGTPQEAALRFIKEHEQLDRGWYAGPIGWIGEQTGEFAVALRSAVIAGSHATLFAGCGIVADSDPDLEYNESMLKLRPMQAAIAAAVTATNSDANEIAATTEVLR